MRLTQRPYPWLFRLPLLALAAAALACAQLAGPAAPTPLPATTAAPAATVAPATTAVSATTAAPATTVAAATTVAPVTDTPGPGGAGAPPCVIVVRTPPASAPTASSNGTALPQQIDPHVEVCASATTVKVGDTLTVLAQVVDVGIPTYLVSLQDDGAADPGNLLLITFENVVQNRADVSQVLALVSATAHNNSLVLTLQARAAGHTELRVLAHGEIHAGGSASVGDGESAPLSLTVTP